MIENKKAYFEVTKYNPIFRDENGYFVKKNEWISYSDIGYSDDDGILTRENYLEKESKYIDAIKFYVEIYKFEQFNFTSIEAYSNKLDFLKEDLYLYEYYKNLKRNKEIIINVADIEILTQLVLRAYIWGKYIFIKDEFEIGFGCDYYMDFLIGDSSYLYEIKRKIIKLGLFWGRKLEDNIL